MSFRESTRTSDVLAASNASRNNSTHSDRDRGNHASFPMQQSNNRRPAPQRKMARQKTFGHPEEDLDYAIDTSALHKALPEFSDGRSNGEEEEEEEEDDDYDDEEDEEDMSIEIGRGRKTEYRRDDSRDSFMSLDDSRNSASPAGTKHEPRQSTYSARPALQNISNRRNSRSGDDLRKNAQIRRASQVSQKENVDPGAGAKSRNNNNNRSATAQQQGHKQRRRTLSDMHAKVAETYDGSYLGDERPSKTHMTAKNTRFGYSKPYDQNKIADAVNRASSGEYAEGSNVRPTRRQPKNNTWTDHESFDLPDVENLSELVSGIYHDGAAQTARQTRPRTTRFTSPPAVGGSEQPQQDEHVHFDGVPIPDDEKAIFGSLRLLQRKVSSLEKDNVDAEAKLEQLREENTVLRAEQSRWQNTKSRVSGRDEDGEGARGGAATLAVEKNRLEAANTALQDQVETARRKLSGHESSVQHAKHERNSLVNQLGTAYMGYQELKTDNEALRHENEELKAHLTELTTGVPATTTKHSNAEQTRTKPDDGHHTGPQMADQRRREKDDKDDALFSLDLPSRRPSETKERKTQKSHSKSAAERKLPNTSRQRSRKFAENNDGGAEFETTTIDTRGSRGHTKDLTYLSFIDSREIAQLRKTLEQERVARKHGRARGEAEPTADLTTKSLLKDATRKSSKSAAEATRHSTNIDVTEKTNDTTTGNQDFTSHKENLTRASSRKEPTRNEDAMVEDATSAFILPDITMHGARPTTAGAKAGEDIQLPIPAQRALDCAVRHERSNCTVCKKDHSSTGNAAKDQSVEIPKLAPVSERAHPAGAAATTDTENNIEEHTLRPSQPPSIALAKVLKILEDELAHLKMQLAVCQSRFSRHDAAAGKRKRVKLGEQMKVLMAEIENRSEVVYSLYDVLEGQKEAGGDEKQRAGASAGGDEEDEDGSDVDDDDLPWEGFGSTQDDITGTSRRRRL